MMSVRTLSKPLLAASTLALSACAVGPDYRPPVVASLAKQPFKEAASSDATSTAPASSTWWELYSDPALSRLIDDAFRFNTDIRMAAANLRRARAELSEARAGRLPTTDLAASYSRNRVGRDQLGPAAAANAGGGASGSARITSTPTTTRPVSMPVMSWTCSDGFRVRSRRRAGTRRQQKRV